jgi:hypothetical protein
MAGTPTKEAAIMAGHDVPGLVQQAAKVNVIGWAG